MLTYIDDVHILASPGRVALLHRRLEEHGELIVAKPGIGCGDLTQKGMTRTSQKTSKITHPFTQARMHSLVP